MVQVRSMTIVKWAAATKWVRGRQQPRRRAWRSIGQLLDRLREPIRNLRQRFIGRFRFGR
jgi:hypothetical protein